jgi:CRISPR-associated protein Cas2
MHVVVAYDIPDNKRRERLRKALLRFGNAVQYSVFECDLSPRQIKQMAKTIRSIISKDEDNIRYYQVCKNCIQGVEVFGGKLPVQTKIVYIV